MNLEEFQKCGEDILDYIENYLESISDRKVATDVNPGYLKTLIPESAPNTGEPFEKIMQDIEKYIMPGLNHWQHPGFHAYFPSVSSYPSILSELIAASIGCTGICFNMCPSGSELQIIVLNWFGRMVGLPECLLYQETSTGGGILQATVSECILICMIAARQEVLGKVSQSRFSLSKPIVVSSLVAYCSKESQSRIKKAAAITMIKVKILDTDEDFRLRGDTLENTIKEDKKIGLIPFFVNVTLGTASGACDPLDEIGPICEKYGIWLNCDASYAGNALVCPEYRHYLKGSEYVTSFNMNPAKWFMIHLDCSILFVKDRPKIWQYVMVNRTLFEYNSSEEDGTFQSNKAFRSFKLWFMMRSYGIEGLQKYIRNHIQLAKLFAKYVDEDEYFEVITCNFGIICFRLKDSDQSNRVLLNCINSSGRLILNSYLVKEKYSLRFVLCSEHSNEDSIATAWAIIKECADNVLKMNQDEKELIDTEEQAYRWDYRMP